MYRKKERATLIGQRTIPNRYEEQIFEIRDACASRETRKGISLLFFIGHSPSQPRV